MKKCLSALGWWSGSTGKLQERHYTWHEISQSPKNSPRNSVATWYLGLNSVMVLDALRPGIQWSSMYFLLHTQEVYGIISSVWVDLKYRCSCLRFWGFSTRIHSSFAIYVKKIIKNLPFAGARPHGVFLGLDWEGFSLPKDMYRFLSFFSPGMFSIAPASLKWGVSLQRI